MRTAPRKWTAEDAKICISASHLVEISEQLGRTLPSIYTMRNSYKNYLKGILPLSKSILAVFETLNHMPLSPISVGGPRIKRPQGEIVEPAASTEVPAKDPFDLIFENFKTTFLAEVSKTLESEIEKIRKYNYDKGFKAGEEHAKSSQTNSVQNILAGIVRKIEEVS